MIIETILKIGTTGRKNSKIMLIFHRKERNQTNFYRQFGNPKGLTGEFVGYLLALKNQRRTDWVISLMNIESGDKILEIGYGPGIAVEKITKILTTGSITGIDISSVMQKQAFKRNLSEIKKGKARLSKGSIDSLGLNEKFDKIFGIPVPLFLTGTAKLIAKLWALSSNSGWPMYKAPLPWL